MILATKNVLSLSPSKAKEFFLKEEMYSNITLPTYFSFQKLLDKLDKRLQNKNLKNYFTANDKPYNYDDVNYIIYNNKDGCYAWRPLQLLNPIIYVALVNYITQDHVWKLIKKQFKKFQKNKKISSKGIPVLKSPKKKQQASQVANWWNEVEQLSLEQALEYSFLFSTDISDCYGSIYTHSISWALHGKSTAKQAIKNSSINLEGDEIDTLIRYMTNNQTNGIPQGSVLMDFIAEIVLGYADLLLTQKLNNNGIEDYKIIRYRDDYRIFVRNTQTGNQIIKYLTEVMIELGFKLNATKTQKTEDVIEGSLKKDKLYRISHLEDLNKFCLNKGNLQKQLIRIYDFAKRFPNSGSLQALLMEYNKNLKFKKDDKNIVPIISIAFSIAYNNPRVYPTIAAIIGKSLSYLSDFSKRYDIILKIEKKLEEKPNTEYMEIWLQRIIYNDDYFQEYNSDICKLVMDKTKPPLWNIDWVSNGLKNIVNNTPIINYEELNNLDSDIRDDEIDIFYYDD
ncbi:MAG: RNA-directed DNA polymerase [Candidatus Gastranaerophilales bacterium]|nr:RNA-directed DNA polymerase [Candidatus Gastranaerophilales bacterium]